MVNTVGSCENKHWQKKWVFVKKDIALTQMQRSLIVGSLLGDGTMRLGEGAINANFKVEQGLIQKAYVFWKYKILQPLVFTEPKLSYRYDIVGKKYPKSWWFRTVRHPVLTEVYQTFYTQSGFRTGRKIVPENIVTDLNPLALAVWIMDDGSYSRGKIDISTYSFTLIEIEFLRQMLEEKFNINMSYYRDRDKGYRLYCNMVETQKLIKIIRPYIIPTMMYKIGFRNPVTTGSESALSRQGEDGKYRHT